MSKVQVIHGLLRLTGALAQGITFGAQSIGGDLTVYWPNTPPTGAGQVLGVQSVSGSNVVLDWETPAGADTGDISSIALTVPSELSVAGSPLTSNGTLAITWASASGNKVIASPANGSSGPYAGRALVAADIPSLPYLATTGGSTVASFSFTAATGISLINSTSGDIDITQSGSGIVLISGPNASSIRIASNGMLLTPGSGQATTIRSPRFSGEVLDNTTAGAAHTGQLLAADNTAGNLVWTDNIAVASVTDIGSGGVHVFDTGNSHGIFVGASPASAGEIWLWSADGSHLLLVNNTAVEVQGTLHVSNGLKDGVNSIGASGQLLSSTGTATAWVNPGPVLYDTTGTAAAAGDNHIASGSATLPAPGGSSLNQITVTLTGNSVFSDTNYVVQLTRNTVAGTAGDLSVIVVSGSQFTITSATGDDASVVFWSAIGLG